MRLHVLITGKRQYDDDHITASMRDDLHWLPVRQRIQQSHVQSLRSNCALVSGWYLQSSVQNNWSSPSSLYRSSWLMSRRPTRLVRCSLYYVNYACVDLCVSSSTSSLMADARRKRGGKIERWWTYRRLYLMPMSRYVRVSHLLMSWRILILVHSRYTHLRLDDTARLVT